MDSKWRVGSSLCFVSSASKISQVCEFGVESGDIGVFEEEGSGMAFLSASESVRSIFQCRDLFGLLLCQIGGMLCEEG